MPRTITTTRTVFKFEELSEDAQQRAVERIAEKMATTWWDQHDNDDIGATIVYKMAEKLRTRGWDTFGEGDFPGIPGVELVEWDLGRGQAVSFKGALDRENAPALPWADGVEAVTLGGIPGYGIGQSVYVETDGEAETDEEVARVGAAAEAMKSAVEDAIHAAWQAGKEQEEWKGGEERARDWIEANEPEFDESGNLDH
ncbi:hypothetical protein [Micromonospora sp. NPDC047730]|uniref:hypothetical protein n=1 Tax=Micromonospora sp. NPDC047730 TaxID=3364253 RepID=UPI003711362C